MPGRWCGVFWTVLFLIMQGSYATLIDLGNMLRLMTDRNPLDFVNYGNWCGLGGGGYAVDEIDWCCKMHDFCYDRASETVCTDTKPHLATYKWKYAARKIHCSKRSDACGLDTCRCDGKFSACVQIHLPSYNPANKKKAILNLLDVVITPK